MINFFQKQPLIEFMTEIHDLEYDKDAIPKPAKSFMPQWWKDIPFAIDDTDLTIKACPSYPDFFASAFVMRSWVNITFEDVSDENNDLKIKKFSDSRFGHWTEHPPSQMLDYGDFKVGGRKVTMTVKAHCPWNIRTPKGYSVLQLPMTYEFNQNWSVMPGIIDTDIHPQVNQQLLIHSNGEDIVIKKGEPLAMYIPFKREKWKNIIKTVNHDEYHYLQDKSFRIVSKHPKGGGYREMQRERDKDK